MRVPPPGEAPSLAPLRSPDTAEVWVRYKTGAKRETSGEGEKKFLGIFTHECYDDEDDQDDEDVHVAR